MAQIFDPLPSDANDPILCCYVNATSKIQLVRITNIPNWYFERVVFPGQRLVFEALSHANLEIHSGMMASAILTDTISCDRLRIEAELETDFEVEPTAASAEPETELALITSQQQAVAIDTISPGKTGRVKFQGTSLPAQARRNETIDIGETVNVVEESYTLIVESTSSSSVQSPKTITTDTSEINIRGVDSDIDINDAPLLDLFTRLREAGLPLGIDEYHLLLRSLQQGFGTRDRAALADLCRTLWVKSSDDEHLFNYHFEQLIKEPLPQTLSSESSNFSETSNNEPKVGPSTSPTPTSTPVSAELMKVGDEIQVAEAVQISTRREEETISNRFTQTDEYFPVTRRQMKQSWRHLRRLVREGLPTELDVEATINRVVQQGVLLEPVLVPRRVNRTELLLLIDQKGSMVPFHALSERLAETAERGGGLGQADIYYFHNCPTRFLYREPTRQKAEPVTDVLAQLRSDRSVVLIFSDAGAARGGFSMERLELTETFLEQLKQRVRYITWLNPIPQVRWDGTTAGEIARLVPMFEITRQGMDQAIDVLRGKPMLAGGQM